MEKHLGHRLIQRTGRGSYIVSLPKKWVQTAGLDKGSEIEFKLSDDFSLVLIPRKVNGDGLEVEKRKREFWVNVEPKDDVKSVCRKVKALYVAGADMIRIRLRNKDDAPKFKEEIKDLARSMLLGSEIVDETSNEIVIQILVKHTEFSVERAIRRMSVIALSAHMDAIISMKKMDQALIQSVMKACNDVNRLNLYVVRQLKFGIEQNLFRELGLRTPKEFLAYRIVVNDVKSIAENAKNILNHVLALKKMLENRQLLLKEPLDEEVYSQILHFNSIAHKLLENSINASFKWDYKQADQIIAQIESIGALENDIVTMISSKKLDPIVSSVFSIIFDSSRRIIEYSRNIAEVTLNKTVEEISLIPV
ncbi:MAG: phosphate uptake regulator PhoU [Candidatus Bathyarchaeota archaeon]|nr:phosphate uptake regulator PhoU [Candidatus Bathyarchaeota archaeon]